MGSLTLDAVALVTASEASLRAHIPARRIRVWAHREIIAAVGATRDGRPLYSLRDVWEAEAARRHAPGPRPRVLDAQRAC